MAPSGRSDRRSICQRVADLLLDRQPPLKVEPRHRISGPREVPSDWYTDEGQKRVAEQCAVCHGRMLPGMPPLVQGKCGPCRELPPAA